MVTFADEMTATAVQMLAEFGAPAVLRRTSVGSGAPRNPGAGTPMDYPCTVFLDGYSARDRDGTRIKAGDKKVLLSTDGIPAPSTSDQMVIDGQVHSILDIASTWVQGTTVLWTLQCRR